jgi:hypothetical protein
MIRSTPNAPFAERFRSRLTLERVCLAAAGASFLIAFLLLLWHGPLPLEGLVRKLAQIDQWTDGVRLAFQPGMVRKYYRLSLVVAFSLAGLSAFFVLAWSRLNRLTQEMVRQATWTMASACALCIYIFKMTTPLSAAPVEVLMSNPAALPIFGHRLLFVWLAKAFQATVPRLSPWHCFYASQVVASFLAIYAVGRWSALHAGESLSSLGKVLAVILISTCLGYRNFYDVGIVFFFSYGLLALYRRKYAWFVVIVTVGTLNHENILLLIPIAAFLLYDAEPRRIWLSLVAVSLAGHMLARAALQWLIPFQKHFDWRIWSNMTKPFLLPVDMAISIVALGGWYVLGFMSLPACDKRLRRLVILFPMLFGITFLFGQFHEPRQFDAFIPVLIAVLLCNVKRMLALEKNTVGSS